MEKKKENKKAPQRTGRKPQPALLVLRRLAWVFQLQGWTTGAKHLLAKVSLSKMSLLLLL